MSRARPYLPLATALGWEPEAARRGVSKVARSARGFMRAYERAGSAKRLPEAWKRKREGFVARHVAQAEAAGEPWFEPGGSPTRRHLALIMWAYSPEPRGLAKHNPVETIDRAQVGQILAAHPGNAEYTAAQLADRWVVSPSFRLMRLHAWLPDLGVTPGKSGRSITTGPIIVDENLHGIGMYPGAEGPAPDFAVLDGQNRVVAARRGGPCAVLDAWVGEAIFDRLSEKERRFETQCAELARNVDLYLTAQSPGGALERLRTFVGKGLLSQDRLTYLRMRRKHGGGAFATNPLADANYEAQRNAYRKSNPRAIPISPKLYEKASKRMVAAASCLLKNKSGETAFESAGQIIFRNLHGKRMVVTLQAFALPDSHFKGEPYDGPYLGGGFLITQDAANEAKGALFLEFRMPPKGTKPPTKQQLETLLSRPIRHELTHAVDPQTLHHYHAVLDSIDANSEKAPSKYEDDPIEVKAFQREVVDEVFRALPSVLATPAPGTILERALDASPMWAARSAGMGDRNRKRVLQAVYRAVAEEGIDPSMRIGAPARSFYREPNPRAVPLDRSRMEQIADTLVAKILKNLDDPDYADDPYPRGIVAMLPDVDMPIVPSFGGPEARRRGEKLRHGPSHVKVDIWVRATDDDRTDASLEGDTKAQHPKDYPAGYMPYGLDIILRLPGRVSKRSWKSLRRRLREEVLRVLLHEATHFARLPWIRSKKSPRPHKSQAPSDRMAITREYLNDPEEIEARTQEIIAQAFDYLGTMPAFVRPSMQTILEFSPAWEEIDEYLTESNKRKVVQKVYRSLSDAGVAPTRARETTIEREFGESDDDDEFEDNPVVDDLGLSSVTENGVRFETGRPVEFRFVHGKIPAPNFGAKFQQDIEPAGRYLVHQPEGLGIFGRPVTDRVRREYEDGTMRFNRPLVLRFTDDPDSLYGPDLLESSASKRIQSQGKGLVPQARRRRLRRHCDRLGGPRKGFTHQRNRRPDDVRREAESDPRPAAHSNARPSRRGSPLRPGHRTRARPRGLLRRAHDRRLRGRHDLRPKRRRQGIRSGCLPRGGQHLRRRARRASGRGCHRQGDRGLPVPSRLRRRRRREPSGVLGARAHAPAARRRPVLRVRGRHARQQQPGRGLPRSRRRPARGLGRMAADRRGSGARGERPRSPAQVGIGHRPRPCGAGRRGETDLDEASRRLVELGQRAGQGHGGRA